MSPSQYNSCVKDFADRVFRFAVKTLGNDEDAKDIVQQSFLTLWEKREEVKFDSAKSFLFTVTYRRCMDVFRTKKQRVELEDLGDLLSSEEQAPPDLKELLEKALATLKPQNRTLVILKDYEGYSYEEISKVTGLSSSQVKVYLHRARKKLREYLISKDNLL